MSIKFRCKKCGKKYQSDDEMSGESFSCEDCGAHMQVPHQSTDLDTVVADDTQPEILDRNTGDTSTDRMSIVKVHSSARLAHKRDDIEFACKICGHKYRLAKEYAGHEAECAKCKRILIIPKHSDNAAADSPDDKIVFWCKSCGQKYRLPKDIAGEEGECSRCHTAFIVPGKSEERPPAPESRKAIEKATAIASFIPVVDKNKDKIQKISVHSTTSRNKSPDDIIFCCKVCNQKYRLPKNLGGQLAECAR